MQTWDKYIKKEGLLLVVSGPSGVGKDAVLAELMQTYPGVYICVTTTTRAPRDGEVDGVDYTFVPVEEFRRRVEADDFLEYAEVHGNMYGTPRSWVEDRLSRGDDIILKIDVQGGLAVKQRMPQAVMIFLVPPSLEELERRLRSRLTESDDEIAQRLLNARTELEHIPCYDYVVENDTLRKAADELRAIIIAEHCRIKQ